jgi:hypothetical protein
MQRIAYFVHSRGRGHAVRTRAVLDGLDEYEVQVFGAGDALQVLRNQVNVEAVVPYAPGPRMARAFTRRLAADRRRLQKLEPSLVVSDGDGPSVHAAWSLGIPVLAVGHGLVFRHAHLPRGLSVGRRLREIINSGSSSWPAKRRVAVHFAPVTPSTEGTVVVRPDLDLRVCGARPREDFVLAYFRDDDGVEALERIAMRGHRVVLFGTPSRAPRGIEVRPPDFDAFRGALARCCGVVGSAGNQLPAECAMTGIPMLALYRGRDAEHSLNARLIETAGIGVSSTFSRFGTLVVRRFEAELDRDRTALAARTRAMPPASEVVPRVVDDMCRPTRAPLTRPVRVEAAASAR